MTNTYCLSSSRRLDPLLSRPVRDRKPLIGQPSWKGEAFHSTKHRRKAKAHTILDILYWEDFRNMTLTSEEATAPQNIQDAVNTPTIANGSKPTPDLRKNNHTALKCETMALNSTERETGRDPDDDGDGDSSDEDDIEDQHYERHDKRSPQYQTQDPTRNTGSPHSTFHKKEAWV